MTRFSRFAVVCLAVLAFPATALARVDVAVPAAPTNLKAFLLRPDERASHEFSRTPAFAWTPVKGALRYEFELATSTRFSGSAIVWTNVVDDVPDADAAPATGSAGATEAAPAASVYSLLKTPAVALDVALPWITGNPYALYAHVRAITKNGPTRWSTPFGFNVRWADVPRDQPLPYPGLMRWTPVDGATRYEVWLMGARRVFSTTTNVADARDLYLFHRSSAWTASISYRVRAVRSTYGKVASGLPTTTFGPWSPIYTNVQPPLSIGLLAPTATVSTTIDATGSGKAHGLTPGFVFGGDTGGPLDVFQSIPAELYRVYVATDKDCVNIVFRGAIVASPAYAPRLTGTLDLPQNDLDVAKARNKILDVGTEGQALMLDGSQSIATEEDATAGAASGSGSPAGAAGGSPAPAAAPPGPKVDLPDTAWPTGGYYWTVVPVHVQPRPDNPAVAPPQPGQAAAPVPIEYRETELPQDACQSGQVMRFGKAAPPVVSGSGNRPFVAGLSPTGRLVAAARTAPAFYGTPLVAWQTALGAEQYEVQWSKTGDPFKPAGKLTTPATSALLSLEPGTWYYRVRGYNYSLPGNPQMAWTDPLKLVVSKPTFKVVK